jgi:hypothetical protein
MGRTPRRVTSTLLTCFLVLGLAGPAGAALTDEERALRAVGWIAPQQGSDGSFTAFSSVGSTADAVLAFVAAGAGARETRRALSYLRRQVVEGELDGDGLKAKVVLAWTAAGRGARTIGGVNLVRELKAGWSDGTEHVVYDTALTVLALRAAETEVPAEALALLQEERCADGAWAYDGTNVGEDEHCQGDPVVDFYASDTNTTALVVMALHGLESPSGAPLAAAFDVFDALRDPEHGGWGYTWGFETTDANSTGLVLQAYAAQGLAPPPGARKALRRLQSPACGAFAYSWDGDERTAPDLGATIGAVPGLLGKAFPYVGTVEDPVPDVPGCKG